MPRSIKIAERFVFVAVIVFAMIVMAKLGEVRAWETNISGHVYGQRITGKIWDNSPRAQAMERLNASTSQLLNELNREPINHHPAERQVEEVASKVWVSECGSSGFAVLSPGKGTCVGRGR